MVVGKRKKKTNRMSSSINIFFQNQGQQFLLHRGDIELQTMCTCQLGTLYSWEVPLQFNQKLGRNPLWKMPIKNESTTLEYLPVPQHPPSFFSISPHPPTLIILLLQTWVHIFCSHFTFVHMEDEKIMNSTTCTEDYNFTIKE